MAEAEGGWLAVSWQATLPQELPRVCVAQHTRARYCAPAHRRTSPRRVPSTLYGIRVAQTEAAASAWQGRLFRLRRRAEAPLSRRGLGSQLPAQEGPGAARGKRRGALGRRRRKFPDQNRPARDALRARARHSLVGGSPQRLVEAADAVPAVGVAVEGDLVGAAGAGAAVLAIDEVDEALATPVFHPQVQGLRDVAEVVQRHHRRLAEATSATRRTTGAGRSCGSARSRGSP